MTLSDRIHKVKEELRSKDCYKKLDAITPKLVEIEKECTRHITKKFANQSYKLQFTAYDLDTAATMMLTKVNRLIKELHHNSISKAMQDVEAVKEGKVDQGIYVQVINATIDMHKKVQKLLEMYYLFTSLTATVRLFEGSENG